MKQIIYPLKKVWLVLALLFAGVQSLQAQTTVYTEDFESGPGGWTTYDSTGGAPASSWQFGNPAATLISAANSGDSAWVTNLVGNYVNSETSYLESPVFNFSTLTVDPDLSFALFYETENCCDEIFMEISIDGGLTWNVLGTIGSGTNWYTSSSPDSWRGTNSGWQTSSIELTGTAGLNDVRLRYVLASDGSITREGAGIDDVSIVEPGAFDLAVTAITAPQSGCLGSMETVTVTLENLGSQAQTGFSTVYMLDGGTPVSETFSGSLAPGATATFSFATPADLSATGAHDIVAYFALADNNPANDTAMVNLTTLAPVASYPYNEDFETFTTCIASCGDNCSVGVTNDWTQGADDDSDWSTNSGTTGSTNTGPNVDNTLGTAAGTYLYTEASSCDSSTFHLLSPCFTISGMTQPVAEFFYHMHGSNMGTLNFDISTDNGANWTNLWTQTGEVQTANADAWIEQRVSLASFVGQTVRFRFQGITGLSFNSDIAIDDFSIFEREANDLKLASILTPGSGNSSCDFTSTETVSVIITNNGRVNQSNFPVTFNVNGAGSVTETFTGTLEPDSSATFTFSSTADLTALGINTVTVYTDLASEQIPANDTMSVALENVLVSTFPFLEDFEGFSACGRISGSVDCSGSVLNGWRQDGSDDDDWRPNIGPTNSGSTGPIGDNTTGSGQYMYIEGSGNANLTSNLVSPCFDISGLGAPFASFAYHMFGADMGTLNLDISTDAGGTWTNLWTQAGQVQTADSLPYVLDTVDLSAFIAAGTVTFRFQGIAGPSFLADIAIDDFRVFDRMSGDVGVSTVEFDSISCGLDSMALVTVTLRNFTASPATNIPVSYSLNGGPVVTETYTDTLAGNADSVFTFATTVDLQVSGVYRLAAWTSLPGDGNVSNDSSEAYFVNTSTIAGFPYIEDFELQNTCSVAGGPQACPLSNDWVQAENGVVDDNDWRVNTGGTGSPNTGPENDNTLRDPSGHYLYTEASTTFNLDNIIYTPCFDLTGQTNAVVSFSYHMFGLDMGTLNLDVSTDHGDSWSNIWTQTGQVQTSDTEPWQVAQVGLSAFSGQVINLRFHGQAGSDFTSDMAIDDFYLGDSLCLEPIVSITEVGDTFVVVNVTSQNLPGTGYVYEYGPAGFTLGTGTTGSLNSPLDTINGLSSFTDYELFVRSLCTATDTSSEAGPLAFTTDCASSPIGDSLNTAIMIPGFPFTDIVAKDSCFTDVSTLRTGAEVFYTFTTGACTDSVFISTCSDTTDHDTYVFLLDSTGATIAFDDDDPQCGFSTLSSLVEADVAPLTTYTIVVEGFNAIATGTFEISVTATDGGPLIALDSIFSPTCFGDSTGLIDISVSGFTPPYTYDWGNSITTEDRTGLTAGTYTVTVMDSLGCTSVDSFTLTQPAQIVVTSNVTNAVCFGDTNGAIDITVTGGTGSYTYAWSNSATTEDLTGLGAGTYAVIVTDSLGCTGTASATIAAPAAITVVVDNVTNAVCNGDTNGAINVTVTGGNGGYTFNWGGGITVEDPTGLGAGTYNLVVTDSLGCTGTATATVTEPTPLVVTVNNITNVNCNGDSTGAIDITVSGGNGGYTFAWSNSTVAEDPTGLTAGTYMVVVTDMLGCTANAMVMVTEPTALAIALDSVTNVTCNGGSTGAVDINVTGGTGSYTYVWSNSATTQDLTGLSAANYTVTVTDSLGCTATTSTTVTEPAPIVVSIDTITNVNCNGDSTGAVDISVTGGTGSFTFAWSNNATTEDLTGLSVGVYTVVVTDSLGCTATAMATVTEPTAIMVTIDSVTNVNCNGDSTGAIDITVTGGTGSYTFDWGNSITVEDPTGLAAGNYNLIVTDSLGCTATASATITEPTAIAVVIDLITNVNCNGDSTGAIDITVSGGSGSYTYAWSNNSVMEDLAGLGAGTYNLVVTDSLGCTATASATITEPTAIAIVIDNISNAICNGDTNGAIDISVTGGTGSYTYAWSNNATTEDLTGLGAGSYVLVVTDSLGCTVTDSVIVLEPAALSLVVDSVVNVACNGDSTGAIAITVSGGNGGYTFDWGGGITVEDPTGLAAGTYVGVITDSLGCTLVDSVTITEATALSLVVDSVTNVLCNGDSTGAIAITVSGGNGGYTFDWGGGITVEDPTGLTAGTYVGVITDSLGCTLVDSVTITEPSAITASTVATDESAPGAGDGAIDLTVNGGVGGYTYLWSTGATTEDINNLTPGTYCVTITDMNGCELVVCDTISTIIATVSPTVNVFDVYPNPTAGIAKINLEFANSATIDLQVVDLLGHVILRRHAVDVHAQQYEIDLSTYTQGTYFIRLMVDGKSYTKKVVLRR